MYCQTLSAMSALSTGFRSLQKLQCKVLFSNRIHGNSWTNAVLPYLVAWLGLCAALGITTVLRCLQAYETLQEQ